MAGTIYRWTDFVFVRVMHPLSSAAASRHTAGQSVLQLLLLSQDQPQEMATTFEGRLPYFTHPPSHSYLSVTPVAHAV